MSAPTNAVAQTGPGAWETIKTGVVDTGYWLGRQVQMIGSAIKNFAVKTYEWAKPAFQAMAKFISENFEKAKELVMQNKQMTAVASGAFAVGALIALASYHLCCSGESPNQADA